MANETNSLQIIIEAVNKASAQLTQVEKDLTKLSTSAKTVGTATKQSSAGVQGMATQVASLTGIAKTASSSLGGLVSSLSSIVGPAGVVAIVIGAVILTLKGLYDAVNALAEPYNKYETAILGLSSVSAAFGESQSKARDAAMSLAQDGLISVTTAATGLRNLMSAGLGLDKSIEMMYAYKNEAAFGRANTISFDQAVGNLSESFKTENSMIGNLSGQTENYNYILDIGAAKLGKTTATLTSADRIQAKYLGTLEVAKKNIGDTTLYTDTYQGSLSRLRATFNIIGIQIGTYFQPILKNLNIWLERMANATTGWLIPAMKFLAQTIMVVVGAMEIGIDVTKAYVSALMAIPKAIGTISFDPITGALKKGGEDIKEDWENINKALADINDTSIAEIIKNMQTLFDTGDVEAAEKAKKLAKAQKEYEKQLESLVMAHREAWKKIKKDIKAEDESFKNSMEDMKKEFEDSMKDIEDRHTDKTKSILADIEAEKRAFNEEVEGINEEWGALMGLTQTAGQDRLANLQAQLDKELALGSDGNQEKIDSLKELIARENTALEEALATQEATRDEEISDVQENLDSKLSVLQTELDEEAIAFEEALIERQEKYDEDVADAKQAHDTKIKDLKSSLAEEEQIRKKYADDFRKIGDKMAEDDITALKKSYQEQLAEFNGFNDTKLQGQKDYEADRLKIIEDSVKEEQQLRESYMPAEGNFIESSGNSNWKQWANLFGFQHGGVVSKPSIVGEKGYPEVVLPLNEPQRISDILKGLGISGESSGSGKVTQNFYITVNSQSDVDMVMERALFNARYLK